MTAWRRARVLVALACASACASRPLAIVLLQPQVVSPDAGVIAALRFSVAASWDGGRATTQAGSFGDDFSLDLPTGTPIDVEVDGTAVDAPPWRGEWHGTLSSLGPSSSLSVLMLPVGFVSSFPALAALPMLAGSRAVGLDEGRVLVTGGIVASGGVQQAAWIYDQSQVAFVPAATPARPRAHHLAFDLDNGLQLLAGGDADPTLEVYLPSDGGTLSGLLSQPQVGLSGAVLGGGQVVVGCGWGPDGGLSSGVGVDRWPSRLFFPIPCSGGAVVQGLGGALVASPDGTLRNIGPDGGVSTFAAQAVPRSGFGAAPDGRGGVLVAGGRDATGHVTRLIEDVGPASVATGQLETPRAGAAVVPFDGGYLVVGGMDDSSTPLATAENVGASSLVSGGELPLSQARHFPAAAQIPGYRLVLILSGQGTYEEPSGGLDLYAVP